MNGPWRIQQQKWQRHSKDLKNAAGIFAGPTTCYAFMQAMGLVNDHLEGCAFREIVEEKTPQTGSAKAKIIKPIELACSIR